MALRYVLWTSEESEYHGSKVRPVDKGGKVRISWLLGTFCGHVRRSQNIMAVMYVLLTSEESEYHGSWVLSVDK